MRSLTRIVVVGLLLATLTAASSPAAAEPADVLLDKAQDAAAAMVADPAAQGDPGRVHDDARWVIAYACHVAMHGSDTAGVDVPEPETCHDHEEAIGIAEPPTAVAEPAPEDAVGVADATATDAVDTAIAAIDEPDAAADRTLGFAARTLDRLLRFLAGIGEGLGCLAGLAWQGGVSLTEGTAALGVAVVDGIVATGVAVLDGVVSAATAIVDGIVGTATAVGDGLALAAEGVTDSVAGAMETIRLAAVGTGGILADAWAELVDVFAGDDPGRAEAAPGATDDLQAAPTRLHLPLDAPRLPLAAPN